MIELQQNGHDDDFSPDGNIVPWSPSDVEIPIAVDDHKPVTGISLAMQMGEIMYNYSNVSRTESVAESCSSEDSAAVLDTKPFPLMDLPLEIRIQIYGWVHLGHPVKQAQLTPWYPMPVYNNYFLRAVQPSKRCPAAASGDAEDDLRGPYDTTSAADSSREPEPTREEEETTLLSPYRPLAGLPSALLRANRQLYHETRDLALASNEFIFVNWFSSGLWAARSFCKGLTARQQGRMRQVRLELLSRDLAGTYADEWAELCGFWAAGLRGLRLKVLCGGGAFGSWVADGLPRQGAPAVKVREDGGEDGKRGKILHWVEHGLALLAELRQLEVEIAVADWDDAQRVAFCRDLEDALDEVRRRSGSGPVRRVRVVCVERCGKPKDGRESR